MSFNKRILVFSATYNEIENIRELINGIQKNLPNSSILIIDDNSPDKTQEVINELKKKNESLFLIKREKKLGLDSAHREAFKYAIENNFDYLITMDADLSHDPKELPEFMKNLKDFPFVIGSRYVNGGKCLMKGFRLIMSKIGNKLIKIVSGIKSNEFTTSYRGFDIKNLKDFDLFNVKTTGYSFFMSTLFELDKNNIEIKEIPITFYDRKKGVSKIPKIEIFRTLKNLFFLTLNKRFFS
tara:strand:+ start:1021 stop:1740 length:720 start_codon:yes stop_codon:yes gene_type:complete